MQDNLKTNILLYTEPANILNKLQHFKQNFFVTFVDAEEYYSVAMC